jgi:CheY-like chemotaxis protein
MAHILVIEDEAPLRANLVRFLRLEGHTATAAADGLAGLQAAQSKAPELIFCDLTMPLMSGLQVLAAVQLDARLKPIPFIILSASAEPERLEEALRLGASGYVTKPFNLAQLRVVLCQYLPNSAPA